MRKFKTAEQLEAERQEIIRYMPGSQQQLPIGKLVLIYGRQSTVHQYVHNKESAQQQAVDLLDHALMLGWPDNKRQLFIENQLADGTVRNASGRLRIDMRPGLQEVVALIETGTVGAVLVRAIDRLFRDETMVGPVVFANLCKTHHVLIMTLDDIYDFNNPRRGDDDYNKFILEAIKAKDYIQKHIRGTMVKNRDRKAMRGEFSGHAVPTGFLLDTEHLYYVPNPYFAPVMARLVKRFRELNGNMAQFRREIVGKPIFPDVPEDIIPRVGRIQLTKVEGGYTVKSYDGLRTMLTNVALIGHIAYKGCIVKYNAHPAIVDEADFWYCFNRLSPTDIDGIVIQRPHKVRRHTKEDCGALLQGTRDNGQAVITSPQAAVYVTPQTTRKGHSYAYTIRDNSRVAVNKDSACMRVGTLDSIFETRFVERLDNYRDMQHSIEPTADGVAVWQAIGEQMRKRMGRLGLPVEQSPYNALQQMQQEKPISLVSIPALIEQSKQTIARLQRDYTVNFDLMTDAELRQNRQDRLQLAHDIQEMEQKQQSATATEQDKKDVDVLLQDAKGVWYTYSLEKKRRFIRLVTTSVTLAVLADGWLVLSIKWSPYVGYDAIDTAFIWQQGGAGKVWTPGEESILRQSYASADRAEILTMLPNRSWTSISAHAYTLGLHRLTQRSSSALHRVVSIEDQQIMQTHRLEFVPGQTVWWQLTMNPSQDVVSVQNEWRSLITPSS